MAEPIHKSPRSDSDMGGAVVGGVVATIGFSVGVGWLSYFAFVHNTILVRDACIGLATLCGLLYCAVHPYIGRAVVAFLQLLLRAINDAFGYPDVKWPPNVSVGVGTWWPVTIIAIPIMLVVLLIGMAFRGLIRD